MVGNWPEEAEFFHLRGEGTRGHPSSRDSPEAPGALLLAGGFPEESAHHAKSSPGKGPEQALGGQAGLPIGVLLPGPAKSRPQTPFQPSMAHLCPVPVTKTASCDLGPQC